MFFKWKMLKESGPYALLFLQLLIALVTWLLVTWLLVNDSASSRDICFTSYDTSSRKSVFSAGELTVETLGYQLRCGVGSSCEGDALILCHLLGFSVNSLDRPPQLGAFGSVVYALNELSPLSSFVIRCRFGDLINHCRYPGRDGILLA